MCAHFLRILAVYTNVRFFLMNDIAMLFFFKEIRNIVLGYFFFECDFVLVILSR